MTDHPSSTRSTPTNARHGALDDLLVLDASTLFAGPMAAMHLGDLGARVIKIEHPDRPDPSRGHGPERDGQNLWWKTLGRNKETVQLDLKTDSGARAFRDLAARADVLIENFRPDTLEGWGIGWKVLSDLNPGLVMARVTGFGQVGPYRRRPGFGTLAEAMSGFAAATGEPDGAPTLPPFGLADGIASLAVAFGLMSALHERARSGRGQVVDVAIIEPIMAMLGPQITRWDQLGTAQPRLGNRSSNNAPRNTYRTRDGHWVAVSTSAQNIAVRVMELVGRPDLADQPWFASGRLRAQHSDELDDAVGGWIAQRDRNEVLRRFEEAEAAIAPIYTPADIIADPHLNALGTVATVEDPDLGTIRMQGPLMRMGRSDARVRFTGRSPGADTDAVLREFGWSDEDRAAARADGGIR